MAVVVTNFRERRRGKQLESERRALQDLSLSKIEHTVTSYFDRYLTRMPAAAAACRDMCVEYALESFLLGSSMGRFGFYGEAQEQAFRRCNNEFYELFDGFHDFWLFWGADGQEMNDLEDACRNYLYHWWCDGFDASLKRWRLKLH